MTINELIGKLQKAAEVVGGETEIHSTFISPDGAVVTRSELAIYGRREVELCSVDWFSESFFPDYILENRVE